MSTTPPPGLADLPIGETIVGETPLRPHWHSRGYLPHFECPGAVQHVTFHLADSLPKHVVERMAAELEKLPVEQQDIEHRKRVHAWLDAGHGSCILRIPEIAEMMQNALLYFDSERYKLIAWVVMPNHVHTLFEQNDFWTVRKVVASWKKYSARKICDWEKVQRIAKRIANREIGEPRVGKPVWHREYFDRYIRDERHLANAINYIHMNPVKAGLVPRPEDWRWSSAHPGSADLPIGV